jgi:hypothetical protein
MPNPWVSLRHDQLIQVNKADNKKEQLEKGLEEEEEEGKKLIQNKTKNHKRRESISQSYDPEVQRQRCKNLQRD